jgi:hypothetical protein
MILDGVPRIQLGLCGRSSLGDDMTEILDGVFPCSRDIASTYGNTSDVALGISSSWCPVDSKERSLAWGDFQYPE